MFNIADIVTANAALNGNSGATPNDKTAPTLMEAAAPPATAKRRSGSKGALIQDRTIAPASTEPAPWAASVKAAEPAVTQLEPPNRKTTKAEAIVALLRRETGATLPEIMAVTGWQAHSVRGFLSGTVRKKLGLELAYTANEGDVRRYRLDPPSVAGDGPHLNQAVLSDRRTASLSTASGASDTTPTDEGN